MCQAHVMQLDSQLCIPRKMLQHFLEPTALTESTLKPGWGSIANQGTLRALEGDKRLQWQSITPVGNNMLR